MKKTIYSTLTIFLFFSSIFTQNILSLNYSGGDSVLVNLINVDAVSGFQIKINGIEIMNAQGGVATENEFLMSASGSTVLGFSFSGATIPPGEHHLMTVYFDLALITEAPCFNSDLDANQGNLPFCTLSNGLGEPLGLELGSCAEGCFNNSACNFLEISECIVAVTYYQDADGDGFGNPDITQALCEAIDGYVTNSDDDDDTCSGTISLIDSSCCLSSTFDDCGICDGGGSIENYDCDGNCLIEIDCAGDCGGLAVLDDCGVCNGNNASMDACENCGGDCVTALTNFVVCSPMVCSDDDDEDCNSNSSNLVVADCLGECGGDAVENECGECNGSDGCLSVEDYMPYSVFITSTYPNPFNPSINIEYSVVSVGHVILQIIDLEGKQIETITNSIQTQGLYNEQWTPINVSSGMYLIQLKANNQIQNKKILYLK